jgi:hypothetical protein
MVPKAYRLCALHELPVSCGQTGGCRRVDARFTLAIWTLAFGPLAVETSVPSDACHPWHWSLSALFGWRGMVRETTRSTERANARRKHRFPYEDAMGRKFQMTSRRSGAVFMVVLPVQLRQKVVFPEDRQRHLMRHSKAERSG